MRQSQSITPLNQSTTPLSQPPVAAMMVVDMAESHFTIEFFLQIPPLVRVGILAALYRTLVITLLGNY